MFETKKTQLFTTPAKKKDVVTKVTIPKNKFVRAAMMSAVTTTSLGNHAVKVLTTGSDIVDQFAKCTIYKSPRAFNDINKDMELLFSQDGLAATKFTTYLRLITRIVDFSDGTKTSQTQRGQGLKHEGIFRMIWLAVNKKATFWKNIHLFVAAGSWKDIITMLQYDLVYNGWEGKKLDWDNMGQLILAGLENPRSSNLLKKYLPQIRANSACTTVDAQADNMIAKWICSLIFGTKGEKVDSTKYKAYRKLKTSGTAHEWQKLISQKKMLQIDFNSIHGRALSQLVSSKFLKNQKLEDKYTKWIETKPVAKYTGYVYELMALVKGPDRNLPMTVYQEMTVNKQFDGLIETAKKGMKEGDSGLLVVVDSSGSMSSLVQGTKVSAYNVALSMALYFSHLLKGAFSDMFFEFSSSTVVKTWKGKTPVEKYKNETSRLTQDTNFQSVADKLVNMRKNGVPESDFPTGILCISDGCFNSAGSNKTNTQAFMEKLRKGGFSKKYCDNFKIILWDVPNGYYSPKGNQAFEDFADTPNLFHVSGLDPAVVAFITGVEGQKSIPKTSEELLEAALDQEILQMITL